MERFESDQTSIVVPSGADMAYELGRYRMPMPGPRGLVMERGKYTIIWRKLDGVWKYVVGCWNADGPAETEG